MGIALTTLSTIVILAALAVRERGFKSMAITLLPIFLKASVRSPSSKATSTVSAIRIPLGLTLLRSLNNSGIIAVASSTPKTSLAP